MTTLRVWVFLCVFCSVGSGQTFIKADVQPSRTRQPTHEIAHGTLRLRGFTLRQLIALGAGASPVPVVQGGVKWLDSEGYDVTATFVPTTEQGALPQMMMALLAERFRLEVQRKKRIEPVYLMTAKGFHGRHAGKPAGHSGCKRTGSALGTTTLSRENIPMTQFAELIQRAASGYLKYPVVDETGLTGGWDFALTWKGIPSLPLAEPLPHDAQLPPGSPKALDTSVFDALNYQLGLELKQGERHQEVIVVQHAERPRNGGAMPQ